MKKTFLIYFCLLTFLSAGCSNRKNVVENQADLKTGDSAKPIAAGQILPNGDQVISTAPISEKSWETQPRMSWAGTTVVEMHDGFGNKIEKRSFPDHSAISIVIVRTSAKGEQTIEVYGRNAEFRRLTIDKINLALQGTSNEIAAAAGVSNFQTTSKSIETEKATQPNATQNSTEPAPQSAALNIKINQTQNDSKQNDLPAATR